MARMLLECQRGIERLLQRPGPDSRDRVAPQPVSHVAVTRKFYPHARRDVQTAARLRRRALAAERAGSRSVARQVEAHAVTQRQF